jgi:hypothetical protein
MTGVLYIFLSAYERLAPSELRRFILQSQPQPGSRLKETVSSDAAVRASPCLAEARLTAVLTVRQRFSR